jgi:predicted Co/Zn/Cd cation transporter (cation efflux family)
MVNATSQSVARWATFLVVLTLAWNIVEAIFANGFSVRDESVALLGFGLDSVIEVSAAVIALGFLSRRWLSETTAIRMIGFTFVALAVFLTAESARGLAVGDRAGESTAGIAIAALSLLVMPSLAWLKYETGRRLESHAIQTEAKETALCSAMSLSLLAGLGAHVLFGLWWADVAGAVVIAALAAREGVRALRDHEFCCAPRRESLVVYSCASRCNCCARQFGADLRGGCLPA